MPENISFDQNARKRPVNLSLNDDLVRKVKGLVPSLSNKVEELLSVFVINSDSYPVYPVAVRIPEMSIDSIPEMLKPNPHAFPGFSRLQSIIDLLRK